MRYLPFLLLTLVAATPVQVFPIDGQPVTGEGRFDDETITVAATGGDVTLRWEEVSASSAFTARMRLAPPQNAADWLALGAFGWGHGAEKQANAALGRAVAADPALRPEADAVRALPLGHLRATPEPAAEEPVEDQAGASDTELPPPAPPSFNALSDQELRQAMNDARRLAEKIARGGQIRFDEIELERMIVYTDWAQQDRPFLVHNVESAYRELSKLFNLGPDETPFYGKLPVLMFERREDYVRAFSDFSPGSMAENTAGVFFATRDGVGLMMMWQPTVPRNSDGSMPPLALERAQDRWASTLVHEFTHAFLHRYRGNAPLPNWLNEGVAEWVENELFPNPLSAKLARHRAMQGDDLAEAFFEARNIRGEDYAVAHSMIGLLIEQDLGSFRDMIHALKSGADIDEALQHFYGIDRRGLEALWRERMRTGG